MFQPLQGKALTAGITATSGLGFLLFGYDQGLFSGLLSISSFSKTFNHPNAVIQGQIVSSYDLGCIIGAALSFFIGDRLGRRRAIFLGCTIIIVGGTLQATSFALSQMIVARIVTGVGTGINTTAIPLWQSETSEARHRGKLIVLQLFLLICGLVITNLLNLGLTYVDPANEFTWRFPLAFQCVFALLTMTLLTFMPESPRWLVLKDRPTEAHAIIARLMGRPSDNDEVLLNLQSILDTVQYEQETQQKSTIKELFSGGRQQTFRRIVLGASASFMQQIGGTNVIAYYLSVILKDSFGFSSRMALILSVVDFILYSIWTLIGTQLIDRVGRKNLLLVGAVGQSICFGMAALGLSIGNKPMNGFAVAFIFLFYVFHVSSNSIERQQGEINDSVGIILLPYSLHLSERDQLPAYAQQWGRCCHDDPVAVCLCHCPDYSNR
jgi:sugar porter (SP) family MFS transporter